MGLLNSRLQPVFHVSGRQRTPVVRHHLAALFERYQHQPHRPCAFDEAGQKLPAVDGLVVVVQDHQIGRQRFQRGHGLVGAGGHADDFELCAPPFMQQTAQPFTEKRMTGDEEGAPWASRKRRSHGYPQVRTQ